MVGGSADAALPLPSVLVVQIPAAVDLALDKHELVPHECEWQPIFIVYMGRIQAYARPSYVAVSSFTTTTHFLAPVNQGSSEARGLRTLYKNLSPA